jgi:hypothetical protein
MEERLEPALGGADGGLLLGGRFRLGREAHAHIGRGHFAVIQAAALVEGVDDEVPAPAATAPPFFRMKHTHGHRFVSFRKDARPSIGLHERRLGGGRIAMAAGGADKGLADLLEVLINRFGPCKR